MSQRPALAFDSAGAALEDRERRGRCAIFVVPHSARVSTYWSVPAERSDGPGAWERGHLLDPDPTRAISRTSPIYDWANDGGLVDAHAVIGRGFEQVMSEVAS